MTSSKTLLGSVLLAIFSLSVIAHGSAKFKAAVSYTVGTKPSAAAVGDFNGDGKLDVAVVNSGDASVGDNGGLSILIGNGDGTLKSAANVSAGTNPLAVTVADPNGDGTFQLPTMIVKCGVICTATWVLAGVADLNQDGNMDQVVVQNAYCGPFGHLAPCGEIFTFLGNGDASFGPPPGGWEVPGGSPVAIADFNGDGKLDIAVSRSTGSQCINARGCVFVLAGNGDGTFQNATSLPVGPTPDWVISADLNNDKAPDLVAVNTDNTISVLINSGTDFSIKASTFSPTPVGPGQSATSTLSLSLLNTFNNPVALSCNVQPSQAGAPGCSITPSSVTFDSAGHASAQLTVTAGSSTASTDGPSRLWALKSLAFGVFPIAGLALMGVRKDKTKRIRRNAFTMIFGAVLCI